MESIISNRMRLAWSKMTARERVISEQVLRDKLNVVDLSITELATILKCSVSMINRWTHKLGYEGFKDLQAKAKAASTLFDKYGESFALLQRDVIYSLSSTQNGLNIDELNVITRHIEKSRKVIFYGEAFTFLIADYFAHLLNKIGIETKVMNMASDLALINSTAQATNIFLSISGRNPNLLLAFNKVMFDSQNTFTALITAGHHALLRDQVNAVIEAQFHLSLAIDQFELPLTSKLAIDYVLMSLFMSVYQASGAKYEALIEQIAKPKV